MRWLAGSEAAPSVAHLLGPHGANALPSPTPSAPSTSADPAELAAWVERLLVAEVDFSRELRVALREPASALQAVAVRVVDGQLSVVIGAPWPVATLLERRIDSLKRRLAASGHQVAEIELVSDDARIAELMMSRRR